MCAKFGSDGLRNADLYKVHTHTHSILYIRYLNSVLYILTLMCVLININYKIYKIVILHALYGCETRSGSLREDHRLAVFKNRVMRKLFGLKRE
jgi:hypothetical protein